MQQVYLNGDFMDANQASISPMDRGFLFGDGIYEVIPCYKSTNEQLMPVGLKAHLTRMRNGLAAVQIPYQVNFDEWRAIINQLVNHTAEAQGVYIHISRGADSKRFHAYPKHITPTIFAYAFDIAPSVESDNAAVKTFKVQLCEDLRWKRCHIKSTSLLGNVMHFQQGQDAGVDEVILYNDHGEITEAAACNVFMVKDNVVYTPPLDNQILPGITRQIALAAMRKSGDFDVRELAFSKSQLLDADEIWITSSSKEIAPVSHLDGNCVGEEAPGPVWRRAQAAYNRFKFDD
mgnify:CR=1 FL=1